MALTEFIDFPIVYEPLHNIPALNQCIVLVRAGHPTPRPTNATMQTLPSGYLLSDQVETWQRNWKRPAP